jgi:endonuclease/exonuclease/phosphatase family metal-dependent hydrolase
MAKPFFRILTKRFFIICNFIAAICFVLGAYVKFFEPRQWWFISLFTLSLPYILLTLIIFFFCWLFTKKIWMLISLLAIAFSWRAVQNIFPINFSNTFKSTKNSQHIRVMSWNVEHFDILEHKTHPEKKREMIDLINEYQPDVACFQEMVAGDDDKSINYLGDFKRRLHFTGYFYSYENRLDFDQAHHFGIITFSRFPIINKQTISTAPHNYNSIFQYVDVIANNDTVRIFNIHLQSLKFSPTNLNYLNNPGTNTDTALTQSKNIISKLKRGFLNRSTQAEKVREEINKSPYPVIVCGDFNDVPNSYAYSKIGDGLKNAFVEKGFGFGRTFSGYSPTLRIDNIFIDNIFTISQFARNTKNLSDHFPILADVSLGTNK